jgi:hypothetical protein
MERIYHTWEKWECYPAGFYETKPPSKDMTTEQCKQAYADFLRNKYLFSVSAKAVITEWKFSCEHYLSNERMNRIAWMGQAAMCLHSGVSKFFCGGYFLLTKQEQHDADQIALEAINDWMIASAHQPITMTDALGKTQADLY